MGKLNGWKEGPSRTEAVGCWEAEEGRSEAVHLQSFRGGCLNFSREFLSFLVLHWDKVKKVVSY